MPNSTILETNVINWTHSDKNVRFSVKVGVAYGSDTANSKKTINPIGNRKFISA